MEDGDGAVELFGQKDAHHAVRGGGEDGDVYGFPWSDGVVWKVSDDLRFVCQIQKMFRLAERGGVRWQNETENCVMSYWRDWFDDTWWHEIKNNRLRWFLWWPEAESNRRHTDFQSVALPTELSGLRLHCREVGIKPKTTGSCKVYFEMARRYFINFCFNLN